MIKEYAYRNLTWIDVEPPTSQDVSSLVKKYKLQPIVGDELMSPTWKPRVDVYDGYLFLALQIPIRLSGKNKQTNVAEKEIDFVIGRDFIITSHADTIDPLHSFAKAFETNSILDKNGIGDHAGIIFYYIMKKIYGHMKNDMANIKDALDDSEKHIFLGHERKMVEVLSELSRDLIDFHQTARLHKEILDSFKNIPSAFFVDGFDALIDDLRTDYASVHDLISNCRELLADLRETNDSLLTTKQNESMRLVSILAFVTLPLSLIADIFSMNTVHSPIVGSPYDFEIILGIMIMATLGMFLYFKRKGWL